MSQRSRSRSDLPFLGKFSPEEYQTVYDLHSHVDHIGLSSNTLRIFIAKARLWCSWHVFRGAQYTYSQFHGNHKMISYGTTAAKTGVNAHWEINT